jgi:Protein of unknown function (DUF4058)
MSMIFPGMDPYLEDPKLWPGLHSRMVVYLAGCRGSRFPWQAMTPTCCSTFRVCWRKRTMPPASATASIT